MKYLIRDLEGALRPTIYLLCKWGSDWYEWDVIGWHHDERAMEAEALRRCWEDYRVERAKEEADTRPHKAHVLSPDETEYRRYFVRAVPPVATTRPDAK